MIDQLKLFRGEDYALNSHISIRHPILDEISKYGEKEYFSLVRNICSTPADRKVDIWDSLHIFWDQMDEFELFISLLPSLQNTDTSILFGDFDFKSFKPVVPANMKEVVLMNKDGAVIDRAVHALITDYIRKMHRIKKNVDVGYDDFTKEVMIDDDREEMQRQAKMQYESMLLPLISSLTNCSDFKYRWGDVWELPIGVFMDSVYRVQRYKNYEFIMHGYYNGSIDIKKINKKDLDWMSDLKD